jgi:hypothetical protein
MHVIYMLGLMVTDEKFELKDIVWILLCFWNCDVINVTMKL